MRQRRYAAYQLRCSCLSAIAERLAARDAGNADWQRDLAVSFAKLFFVHRQSGDEARARDYLQQGHAIMARLIKLSPENVQWQKDLALFEGQIAELAKNLRLSSPPALILRDGAFGASSGSGRVMPNTALHVRKNPFIAWQTRAYLSFEVKDAPEAHGLRPSAILEFKAQIRFSAAVRSMGRYGRSGHSQGWR
jgi:hypothetical protein